MCIRDSYTVKFHKTRGADHNVHIIYGKNLTDFKMEKSIENTITGVHPYWVCLLYTSLIPFHAVVITLLIPFQLVVVSDFTALHAPVSYTHLVSLRNCSTSSAVF